MLRKIPPGDVTCTANAGQSRLYHAKPRCWFGRCACLQLVWSPVLFGISRNTFYKYCHQAEQGVWHPLIALPHVHGSAKPQPIIDPVLACQAQYPSFGKQPTANLLLPPRRLISPNTVQRILRTELHLCHRFHARDTAGTPLKLWASRHNGAMISCISTPQARRLSAIYYHP